MKKTKLFLHIFLTTLTLIALSSAAPSLWAEEKKDDHKHDEHEGEAGPNGGRLLTSVEPHLEFLVTDDRKVRITAVGKDGKAVPIGDQSVSVVGGDRSNPTRMKFEKQGAVLVSDVAFPEGNDLPVVIQVKPSPKAKTVMEKFNLNLSKCPTCEYKEYACICEHADDEDEHDHEHKKDEKK